MLKTLKTKQFSTTILTGADGGIQWWVPALIVLAILAAIVLLAGVIVGRKVQARRKRRVEMVAFSNQMFSGTNRTEQSVIADTQSTPATATNNTYS